MIRRCAGRRVALVLVALLAATPAGADPHPEQQLLAALEQLRSGQLDEAWAELESLVRAQPNFRLARLFYDELKAVRGGDAAPDSLTDAPDVQALAEEARLRLYRTRPGDDALPAAVLQLTPGQTHAVVVDLPRARLYLLESRDGELVVARDYYAGIGKRGIGKERAGDNRTPVGVYRVTGFLPDSELPELYGAGAFPLDYPNPWDRRKKRTGDGIWLHGVPRDTYVRAPRSSEGCVTLANADLLSLKPYFRAGETPVILSDGLEWMPRAEFSAHRNEFRAALEEWRRRWSAVDTEGYLEFYADDFDAGGMDRAAFAAHKRRVNAGKSFIEVTLKDVELYRYPASEPLWLARFRQEYRSDNYARATDKDQFWRRDADGRWRIVKEENR